MKAWDRFYTYSSSIIRAANTPNNPRYETLWPVPFTHPIHGHPFPILRYLYLRIEHLEQFLIAAPLLHYGLTHLEICLSTINPDTLPPLQDLLIAVTENCPNLQVLAFNYVFSVSAPRKVTFLPSILARMKELRHLRLSHDAVSYAGLLETLGELKNLEYLRLDSRSLLQWRSVSLREDAFPKILTLAIYPCEGSLDLLLKQNFPLRSLRRLEVRNYSSKHHHAFLGALRDSSITELLLFFLPDMTPPTATDLRPISNLKNLQILEIDAFFALQITDLQFDSFVQSCPRLHKLTLITRLMGNLTLLSIFSAVLHCPEINFIDLSILATQLPLIDAAQLKTITSRNPVKGAGVLPHIDMPMGRWRMVAKSQVEVWLSKFCVAVDVCSGY